MCKVNSAEEAELCGNKGQKVSVVESLCAIRPQGHGLFVVIDMAFECNLLTLYVWLVCWLHSPLVPNYC